MAKRTNIKCLTSPSVIATLALMADGEPRTAREIYESLGFSQPTADSVMGSLHHHRKAHILRYELGAEGKHPAVWVLGEGRNAPHPSQRSASYRAEMMRIYRRRYEDRKKGWDGSPIPHRDPLTVAFYGEYQGSAA